ncbi:response regulator [Patescibacteria group bacterium]
MNEVKETNEIPVQNKKILVIEDDKILSKVISEELEKAGFEIKRALTGDDGFEMARSENPDLVLLDLMLPGIHGFDILAKIKKDSYTKKIPVIILTALGSDDDVKKGLRLGASDYIVKSKHAISEIIDTVKNFFK